MAGYTRQSVADIVSGQVIKAEPINNELNQVLAAFNASTGHKHDGTSAEGAYIPTISDTNNYNKVVIDTTNNRINFFTNVGNAAVEQVRIQDGAIVPVTDEDIDLGSPTAEFKDLYIDGVGYIDTLAVHENATITGNLTVDGNTTLGSDDSDTVTVNADVASDLIPSADGTYDLGSSTAEWQDLHLDGTANIDSLVADTADIDGGTIDDTTIGATTPAAADFTTMDTTGNATVGGTFGVTGNTTLSGTLGVTGVSTFSDTVCAPNLKATGTSTLSTVDINAGNIDGTVIGASSTAAGSFTTVSTTGQGTFATVDINGGTIDGTTIGGTTACPITGTTVGGTIITASTCFAGNVCGSVTGNVTGNLSGNAAGCHTGNFDGTVGATTACPITGTTVTANTCFVGCVVGNVTGDVSGDLTGDAAGCHTGNFDGIIGATTACPVTATTIDGTVICASTCLDGPLVGNVTGDVTGNITSTGTSCFTSLQLQGNMDANSNKITNLSEPTADSDAATKLYVDNAVEGLDVKGSVKVATTANITLSGTQTIDDIAVVADDRVLVKDQSTASENGIYVVAAGAWSRADDADTFDKHAGAFFFVEEGTTNADNGFVGTVDTGGTLDTTDITFVQFSGAGQITAGTGLTKSGNTINVVTADSGRIVTNADNIDLATTGVSAGTYKSVTTDVYGRITGGTNPTTLSGYGITDAYTNTCTDTLLDAKVDLAGDTMTGDLAMGSNCVTSTATPATDDTLTRKGYVDTQDALKLNLSGGTMTGAIDMGSSKITTTYTPTDNADLTTKTYVDGILGSATAAATSATCAAASATAAATSETCACASKDAAAASATSAADSYDDFDDRYLGNKASDPSVDNDGDGLITGALYWNTTDNALKVYTGSAWNNAAFTLGDALSNVSDDTSPTLGGNLDAATNNITNATTICATNLCGTLTGNVTGNVTGTVSDISNHDTGDLTEGSNQYFTTARVDSHLTGGTGVTYTTGTIAIGQSVGTSDNVCFGSVCVTANPTLACQLATKEYVDTIAAAGIHYHDPVRVEHPSNLSATYDNGTNGVGATLTNNSTQAALVLDDVTMAVNDRVLVANQTNAYENGVYTVTNIGSGSTNWVLTRSTDADTAGPSDPNAFGKGDAFFIKEGTTNAGHLDVLTTTGTIVFGTTNIVFAEVAETSIYDAGNGLNLTGTTFTADAGTGVTVDGTGINIGQAVGTSDNVTFNNITGAVLCGTTCVKAGHLCATTCGLATCCFYAPKVCATTCMASPCFAGNATSATSAAAWTTARTLCICGDVTGCASVDGSGNVNLLTAVADDSHNHTVANVDGLATCLSGKAATNGSTSNNFSGACICAANCFQAPYIAVNCGCAGNCFKSPVVCGSTALRGACAALTTCVCTPYLVSSGIVCAGTCLKSACCVISPVICGSSWLAVGGRCICNSAGDYGSISVSGGDNNWCGYSIANNYVFMACAGTMGLYNDISNQWALIHICNAGTCLYHNGTTKFATASYGTYTAGCHCASNCLKSGVVCGTTTRGTTACFTDFNSTSDCRCKENIATVDNAYCKIGQIRGVNYNWKDSGKYTIGVVAQEVEEAFPELVTTDDDGYKSVNYNGLVGALIETVKCLQGKVEELENGSKG